MFQNIHSLADITLDAYALFQDGFERLYTVICEALCMWQGKH